MIDTFAKSALAWLLTYAVHSTVLLGIAWMISRRATLSAGTRDILWKTALVGGILTSLAQTQLGLHPIGSLALTPATAAAPRSHISNTDPAEPVDPNADATSQSHDRAAANQDTPATPTPTSTRFSVEAIVVGAWALLALVLAIVYLGRRLILVGRLANRRAIIDGPLVAMLDGLQRKVGHRTSIALTSVNTISSPVALGLREICLPEAAVTQLETDQQRGLLAHELAHLVRRDPLWLYSASLIERVFFFQPLNRLARVQLQRTAEYLCDDWAAAQTGSGLPLAHCLARVAEWIEASPLGVPVAGMAEQRSLLVTRVARLIDGKVSGSPASRVLLGAVAAVMLVAVTAAVPGVQPNGVTAAVVSVPTMSKASNAGPSGAGPSTQPQQPEDPAVIAALIERLKDTDAGVRRAAANSLGNLKSRKAVSALIDVLGDKDKEVRAAAANALANIEDPAAVPALSRLLNDPSPDVREHALDGLSHFSDALNADQILPALKDSRASIRAKAVEILGEMGDRGSSAQLVRMLNDQSAEVRHQTIHALEHVGDASAGPAILTKLHDDNADVRSSVLSALRELKTTVPESELMSALKDTNADVRKQAIEFLKEKPSASLVPALKKMLDDDDSDVRQEAVSALSEVRDATARAALREALKSTDPKVRRRAAEALGDRP